MMTGAALENVVVLEVGDRRGCAACGLLLAQTGAEVIVVEPENLASNDKWSSRPTLLAGKRSVVWRDGSSDDNALLRKAVRAADVVILSSDIATDRQHFVSSLLTDAHIVCDITASGTATMLGHGLSDKLMQALTGVAAITGQPDLPPATSDAPVLEFHAGLYAAAGIVCALRVRRLHGNTQRIDVSLYECGVNTLATYLPLYFGGKSIQRAGNRHPMAAPWNAYRAKDGWVLLCSARDEHWSRLCRLMDNPELANSGPFSRLVDRIAKVDAVDAMVNAWFADSSVDQTVELLSKGDIASGPIVEISDLGDNENVRHRRMVLHLNDPLTGKAALVAGTPLKASSTPGITPCAIPVRDGDRAFVKGLTRRQHSVGIASNKMPYEGIRVLEIGQYTTAPLASKHMASLGAEVIKIEPLDGEASRAWPPHQNETSYFFMMTNNGKSSVALDLRNADDRAIFLNLVRSADVLVENMKPGSMTRLGFSPAELQALNPKLLYCGISGFGLDSAYPGRPAFDTVVQAMAGLMDLTRVDGVPTKLGISAGDITGGVFALFAMLVLLEHRDRTGRGQLIDVCMQDLALWITQTCWNGEPVEVLTMIECDDGHVAVAATAEMAATAVGKGRVDRKFALAKLSLAGLSAAPVRTIDQVAEDAGGMGAKIIEWRTSVGLTWPLLRPPFHLSQTPAKIGDPIGSLGSGNADAALGRWAL